MLHFALDRCTKVYYFDLALTCQQLGDPVVDVATVAVALDARNAVITVAEDVVDAVTATQ